MAATVTEMRKWLQANTDEEVPDRGRLRPELVELFNDAHAAEEWDADTEPAGDLIGADIAGAETEAAPAEVRPEVRPSRKRATGRTGGGASGVLGRLIAGDTSKKPAPKRGAKAPPRVSLEKFTGRLYSMAGRLLAPVSPAAATCVAVQAPIAGVLLDEIVVGTVADRMLQPLARAEEKLDVAFALIAPPVACMAIEMAQPVEQTPEVMFRTAVAYQMLREGLRTGLEVSGKYAERVAEARARQLESDAKVDELIALIFQPRPSPEEMAAAAEMAGAAAA